MTMSEKILAKNSNKPSSEAGEIVMAAIDVAMTHTSQVHFQLNHLKK